MTNKSCKSLLGLALVASCGVAFVPKPATAGETTFPTIHVIVHEPQSQGTIDRLLDQVVQPALIRHAFEDRGMIDRLEFPTQKIDLPIDCRLPQEARMDAVEQGLSVQAPTSGYLPFGTTIRIRYANGRGSERFVVTGGDTAPQGSYNSNLRAVTPVAGSYVCKP